MKEAIVILSALFLLTQGPVMAGGTEWERMNRGPTGHRNGYDCPSLEANAKLELTAEQAARLRALDEKYGQEIDPIRERLYRKGQELKAEWLQPQPDRGRIEILQGEAAKIRERMRATLAAQRAEVLKVLTLEQRAHLPDYGPGRVFIRSSGFGRQLKWR